MKINGNNAKGITLIALIITIIILVILAAVSIGVAYQTGIIKIASKGVEDYVKESVKENKTFNETISVIEDALRTRNYGYFKKTGTINGEPGNSYNPTIPAGFRAIDVGEASWGNGIQNPSKESVNAGLVIEDEAGNQFVWVPCTLDGSNGTVKYERDSSYNSTWTEDGGNTGSISTYGGFYIGRYEAGVPDDAPFYASKDGQEFRAKNENGYNPVSKANNQVWNSLKEGNAELVSESMYRTSKSVSSALVDGFAWDTTVSWIQSTGKNINDSTSYGNYLNNKSTIGNALFAEHVLIKISDTNQYFGYARKYKKGSVTLGGETVTSEDELLNYQDTDEYNSSYTYTKCKELATGLTGSTNNIYDMAGNVAEWTTETRIVTGEEHAMVRGGSFGENGNEASIKDRNSSNTSAKVSPNIGFRVVVYLKVTQE